MGLGDIAADTNNGTYVIDLTEIASNSRVTLDIVLPNSGSGGLNDSVVLAMLNLLISSGYYTLRRCFETMPSIREITPS